MFSNLSSDEELLIQSTRLQAMAIQLVYIVRASNTSALALSDHFLSRVEALKRLVATVLKFIWKLYLKITSRYSNLPSIADTIVKEITQLDDPKPGVLSRVLLPILQAHIYVAPFCLPSKVKVPNKLL